MNEFYFKCVVPTYIENWPEALKDHSISRQAELPLSHREVRSLGSNITGLGSRFAASPMALTGFSERIDSEMNQFPAGVFPRLGSRSPKNATHVRCYGLRELPYIIIPKIQYAAVFTNRICRAIKVNAGMVLNACSLKANNGFAVLNMMKGSQRIAYDLLLALHHGYQPHLFLRQWQEIPAWTEFRCFVVNRCVVGISQYDPINLGACSEIEHTAPKIKQSILQFITRIATYK